MRSLSRFYRSRLSLDGALFACTLTTSLQSFSSEATLNNRVTARLIIATFLSCIAMNLLVSFPISYRRLIRPSDGRRVDLIGDYHAPLDCVTESEATLLKTLNQIGEKGQLIALWEYSDAGASSKKVYAQLCALANIKAGKIFVLDAPEVLTRTIDFRNGDCRPSKLISLLQFESYMALINAMKYNIDLQMGNPSWYSPYRLVKALTKRYIDRTYDEHLKIIGITNPVACKPELGQFLRYAEVLENDVEAMKDRLSKADYDQLKKLVEELKKLSEKSRREFAVNDKKFFEIFSQGLLSSDIKKIEKSSLELLNFFVFNVFDLNCLKQIFSKKNQIVVYVGQRHSNALEQLLMTHFGFVKQEEVLGQVSDPLFHQETHFTNEPSTGTVFGIPQETWKNLLKPA